MTPDPDKPLIVHVLDQLKTGGMESVAVNLIRHTRNRYQHCVVCLRGWEGNWADQLEAMGIPILSIAKQPGKDPAAYIRLWRCLRRQRPMIVHTYNVGTIDAALLARLAGVPHVVHAEHGRHADDPQGRNCKYRWLRRLLSPAISSFIVVSQDLANWLAGDIGIPDRKICLIPNGIDVAQYNLVKHPVSPWPADFAPPGSPVIGSVGRLDAVKGYNVLLQAFARLCETESEHTPRLVIVGTGPQLGMLKKQAHELGIAAQVWLAGERTDVARLLQAMDLYVCSSIAEGMALTILEAMASSLPVVATRVGGNPELVVAKETGILVPPADAGKLAQAMASCLARPGVIREQGRAGRARVQAYFSIQAMVAGYCAVYDQLLDRSMKTTGTE